MNSPYQHPKAALKYLEFLNSPNGQIQKKVLFDAIIKRLNNNHSLIMLDAGCGNGWLSGTLKKEFTNLEACDASDFLIKFAKTHYKGTNFLVAPLQAPLPYQNNYFDVVILNMVGPDLENLSAVFKNINLVLKPGGKLIMTIPNPQLTYPAAEWKKSALGKLLFRKPKLQIKNPPLSGSVVLREFGKNSTIESFFYSTDDYISNANGAGLELLEKVEIKSAVDSNKFDLNYQLFRHPLILLLEFTKKEID